MTARVRIGAVSYLNTRPLVLGLEQGLAAERIELSYDVPSVLADRLAAGELDVALLPVIELASIDGLEILPGLGIVTRGPSRSVLLAHRKPLAEVRRIALDPHSRTSNALVQWLAHEVWKLDAAFAAGPLDVEAALREADAAVRIGDKALFEPLPEGVQTIDLGSAWTEATGLPFVFAVWAARPGTVGRELYKALHASRRSGSRQLDWIAEEYTWEDETHPALSAAYLRENIFFRLGTAELRALERFLGGCARHGIIESAPALKLAFARWSGCHETAAAGTTTARQS